MTRHDPTGWHPDHHHYVRKSLVILRTASNCPNCPPAGHAFLRMLVEIEAFLHEELPRHILEEELELFPQFVTVVDPAVLNRLRREHLAITAVAEEFRGWLGKLIAAPNDADWRVFRDYALKLDALLEAHLTMEEQSLPRHVHHAG